MNLAPIDLTEALIALFGTLITAIATLLYSKVRSIDIDVRILMSEKNLNRERIVTLEAQQKSTDQHIASIESKLDTITTMLQEIAQTCASLTGMKRGEHP
jgi:uncharacterized phage infection (PIP) family protein YhgE